MEFSHITTLKLQRLIKSSLNVPEQDTSHLTCIWGNTFWAALAAVFLVRTSHIEGESADDMSV